MTDASAMLPVMLIAGGTGSIGAEIARQARAAEWTVVVHGRNPAKADIALDLNEADAAARLIDQTVALHGRLDAVIDCVSTGVPGITGLFPDTDPASYAPFYDVSAAWFQRLSHAAYPHLKARGGTLIAFISDAGKFAAPRQTSIGAARAATIGFVRNLAMEAARDLIRVHAISPSYVAGSASAARMGSVRMATAEKRAGLGLPCAADIAPLALFLCSPGAAKITGQIISVNGGLNA